MYLDKYRDLTGWQGGNDQGARCAIADRVVLGPRYTRHVYVHACASSWSVFTSETALCEITRN